MDEAHSPRPERARPAPGNARRERQHWRHAEGARRGAMSFASPRSGRGDEVSSREQPTGARSARTSRLHFHAAAAASQSAL